MYIEYINLYVVVSSRDNENFTQYSNHTAVGSMPAPVCKLVINGNGADSNGADKRCLKCTFFRVKAFGLSRKWTLCLEKLFDTY